MRKTLAAIAVISLLAGSVWAQQSDHNTTTTAPTTKASDENPGQTRAIHKEEATCLVTPNTISFGLLTPEGKYLRFDQPSNKRIVEMVNNGNHHIWNGKLLDARCYAAHTAHKETKTTATLGESTNETPTSQKK